MPPTDDSSNGVGIIYPPPEVRNIVDKTASFVARNGPEFEQKIKQNEINNPKFNFLNSGDPYNAYYQYKVNDIRTSEEEAKNASTTSEQQQQQSSTPSSTTPGKNAPSAPDAAVKQRQQDLLNQAIKYKEAAEYVPKEPPGEFEFIADPPSISAFDLDVVKLTAQFVARNGRQFLTNLMNREQRNYQFDFLRPQHSLFQYFTKLLEQYTKVLIPPKDLIRKLRDEASSEKKVREQIRDRVAWIRHVEAKKRREEAEAERERVSYAQVDWHNFVVVETVDYQSWESGNFPPPTNMAEVGARVLMQRRVESNQSRDVGDDKSDRSREGANTQVQDMEEESSSDDDEEHSVMSAAPAGIGKPMIQVDAAPAVRQPPPSLPTPGNVEVRKYDPKQAQAAKKKSDAADDYLVSPITGERIHASKVQEHMRIGLLDPRWVEERDKQLSAKASEEQVFAPGQSIENSLKHLAERRTDIFGVGEEAAQETAIGKKIGEEEEKRPGGDDKVTWDGHSSSAEAASRAARANFTINEQIEQIHRNKGLIPDVKKDNKPVPPPQVSATISSKPVPPPTTTSVHQPPMMPPTYNLPHHGIVPAPVQPPQMVGMMAPSVMVAPQPFYMPSQAPPAPQALFNHPMAMGREPPLPPEIIESEEPLAKKAKEDTFVPEAEWLTRFSGPITFRINVPNMPDKPEWQLSGQTLSVTHALSDTVSVLKSKLSERIGMPTGKQKLQMGNTFFKDSNTLAFYNLSPSSVVNLQVKERGGRKK